MSPRSREFLERARERLTAAQALAAPTPDVVADKRPTAARSRSDSSRCIAALAPSTTAFTFLAGSSPRVTIRSR
jgi:hypothetical protein